MCKRNIEARSRNHCCRGKAGIITHSVCVCVFVCVCAALVSQHAERVGRIMLSFYYLINGMTFGKKFKEHKVCVFSFSLQILSQTFLILRKRERDIIINVHESSCKVPVILVRF